MTITLIGYRATGKTTVGQELAARIGWEFIDTDHEIERVAEKTIAAIFQDDGEPVFRELERAEVRKALSRNSAVISTGGGSVMDPSSRKLMKQAGPVIWLTAEVATISARLQADTMSSQLRPALTEKGLVGEISAVLELRNPVYAETASFSVKTDGRDTGEIVDAILASPIIAQELS